MPYQKTAGRSLSPQMSKQIGGEGCFFLSKRMLHDIDAYGLIRTTQLGTRAHSSTLDAGLSLVHDVQTAWRYGLKCGALLFDIKGFFDNVHKDRLAAILRNLGFPESMCSWTLSFLTNRRVQLTFNGEVTPEQLQPVGTPQGSPLSRCSLRCTLLLCST